MGEEEREAGQSGRRGTEGEAEGNSTAEREEKSSSEGEGKKKGELSNTARIITSLAAGGIAGGCAKTVIAPLDR